VINNSEDNHTLKKHWFVLCTSLLQGTGKDKSLLIRRVNSNWKFFFKEFLIRVAVALVYISAIMTLCLVKQQQVVKYLLSFW